MLIQSARAKVSRASKHLAALGESLWGFNERKPYRITREDDIDSGECFLIYEPTEPVPPFWPVIVGEILYNLHSALDHAVYELSIPESGIPLQRTAFPIFDDEDAFFKCKRDGDPANKSGLDRIRGLNEPTQAYVASIQPFNARKVNKTALVAVLHEMSNIDKHRTVHICRRNIAVQSYTFFPFVDLRGPVRTLTRNLDERAKLLSWTPANRDQEVDVKTDIVIDIFFDQTSAEVFPGKERVGKALNNLVLGVNSILDEMEARA